MKVRIKFSKSGPLKFIGHLDVMRYFQKAFRRAELDVEYSQGYSPHQLMSFAAPLGVGLTSDGEYLDVSMLSCDSPELMVKKINEVMNENIQIVDYKILPDNSKNAMSIVAGADYLLSLKDGYEFMDKAVFEQKFSEFFKQDNIAITKRSKKSENIVDIKPMIYHIAFEGDIFRERIGYVKETKLIQTVAETYENNIKVYMQLATGSVNNLKPELVMEAFCNYAEVEFKPFAFQVHRLEVYADLSDENNRKLIPLDRFGSHNES
ncbi:TIGR03936 family radical SAM-associated protein [Anaerocolumna sp. MB42-C2]|uniref:TIGR03936 family radical SAM-associated protein n=1 Tax=Anaerocolumna sp. MB42-C2 TaxID=3070997 RepID=UPI0027DEF514|nr:TIGR03936 family radical SAM-associated protein [Anaerocolumna sp. MB42-C2]WMJ88139.1 TIGR03936 family radical SAM-associated protein [Anaerocolumna sp. MB42-C2]